MATTRVHNEYKACNNQCVMFKCLIYNNSVFAKVVLWKMHSVILLIYNHELAGFEHLDAIRERGAFGLFSDGVFTRRKFF